MEDCRECWPRRLGSTIFSGPALLESIAGYSFTVIGAVAVWAITGVRYFGSRDFAITMRCPAGGPGKGMADS